MRGSKAKRLRRIAYDPIVLQYSRNREYEEIVCPNQFRHKVPMTVIADSYRYEYQALKGRRQMPQ